MRALFVLAVVSFVGATHAWISMMGSRQATKWERKKSWLEKRGSSSGSSSSSLLEGKVSSSSSDTATSTVSSGTRSSDGSFTAEIIGSGRIGAFLAQAGDCTVLGRNDVIDPSKEGHPILIATRNDALEGIVAACPENRRKDLVFLQNGYLDTFLESKGLLQNTQVLLYLSVPAKGATPVDGVTTVNPEGLTAATGTYAQAFADRLVALNMKCNTVTPTCYRPAMFEKLMEVLSSCWISTYMLVGTAKECKSVGEAGAQHAELVEQIVNELVAAVGAKEGIAFPAGTMERLAAYTDVVADFPCAVKEFEWRNQYFYSLGDGACPTHNALLRECKEKGFLAFELP